MSSATIATKRKRQYNKAPEARKLPDSDEGKEATQGDQTQLHLSTLESLTQDSKPRINLTRERQARPLW
jgi:hypothetical protein